MDVIAVLTESADPGNYWAQLKRRIQEEGFVELVTFCHQLKMRALDGKLRMTDAADVETMLRIIQSTPSPKAEPVRQWLARVGAERLEEDAAAADLSEAHKRLLLRGEVATQNSALAGTVTGAGVITTCDFAVFQDHGYMGFYDGERARDIAARKGLTKGQHILDWMNSTELAANWFRITQAEEKIRREGIDNKTAANRAHFNMGAAVRGFILEQGGTAPEQLPTPAESIRQLQRDEQRRIEAERQPSLFIVDVNETDPRGEGDGE